MHDDHFITNAVTLRRTDCNTDTAAVRSANHVAVGCAQPHAHAVSVCYSYRRPYDCNTVCGAHALPNLNTHHVPNRTTHFDTD